MLDYIDLCISYAFFVGVLGAVAAQYVAQWCGVFVLRWRAKRVGGVDAAYRRMRDLQEEADRAQHDWESLVYDEAQRVVDARAEASGDHFPVRRVSE